MIGNEKRKQIYRELIVLGFRPNTNGMQRIMDALELILESPESLDDLKHFVYPIIATRRKETRQSVERIIRYAIERAWLRGDLELLQSRFGYTIRADKGKPTNRAFLAQMTEYLTMHDA